MNDITYCVFGGCEKTECIRHLYNAPENEVIWMSEFEDCKNWSGYNEL